MEREREKKRRKITRGTWYDIYNIQYALDFSYMKSMWRSFAIYSVGLFLERFPFFSFLPFFCCCFYCSLGNRSMGGGWSSDTMLDLYVSIISPSASIWPSPLSPRTTHTQHTTSFALFKLYVHFVIDFLTFALFRSFSPPFFRVYILQPASYGKKNGMWYASPGNQGWGNKSASRNPSVLDADITAAAPTVLKPSAGRVIRIINNLDHNVQVNRRHSSHFHSYNFIQSRGKREACRKREDMLSTSSNNNNNKKRNCAHVFVMYS